MSNICACHVRTARLYSATRRRGTNGHLVHPAYWRIRHFPVYPCQALSCTFLCHCQAIVIMVSRLSYRGSHPRIFLILSELPIKTAGSQEFQSVSRQGSLGPVNFIAAANTSLTENSFLFHRLKTSLCRHH